ncbi:hypothetical protein DL765_001468 [Monosporascus sp. GIB2]|nr:hypothetical protein DL765_001468 [Monosporascus sp. GIB2]
MDFLLALLPWKVILNLNMRKTEKIGVALAMSMGIFAGAAAIVKVIQFRSMSGGDFTYDGTSLVIWGITEAAVTIAAASIPQLRVLVRQVNSSISLKHGSQQQTNVTPSHDGSRGTFTSVTATQSKCRNELIRDDNSQRGILHDGILRTETVRVSFHGANSGNNSEYEMDNV